MSDSAPAGELQFGRVVVDTGARQLLIEGKHVPLGARAFDVLVALAQRHDRVVSKDELMDAVWPHVVVEENNLQVQISALRKVLGAQSIATVPGRGYRLTLGAPATAPGATGAASPPSDPVEQATPPAPTGATAAAAATPRPRPRPLLLAALALAGALLAALLLLRFAVPPRAAAGPALRSVLVLPFAAPADDVALGDAGRRLAVDLARMLGDSLKHVRVVAPGASAPTGSGDVLAAGRAAGVRFVVTGDLRRDDGSVAVTLRMVDAQEDRQVDNTRERIGAAELDSGETLARQLTSRTRVMFGEAVVGVLRTMDEREASARDLMDLANVVRIRDPVSAAREMQRLANAAIERDPSLGAAWTARAMAATMLLFNDFAADAGLLRSQIDADSFRAVMLDPGDVVAWVARANALRIQGNLEGGFAALDRAQGLDPSRYFPQLVRAWLLLDAGRPEETLAIVARLRPVFGAQDSTLALQACSAQLLLGAYDAAIVECERVTSWDLWNVPANLAAAHAMRGDAEKAGRARARLLEAVPAFTISAYEARFRPHVAADAWAMERAHFVAGLRKAGVPE